MAGIILSTICAAFLGTATLPANADTTNVYIIDNVEVKNFTGTQLNGKTISAYDVTLSNAGSRIIRTHIIKTAPFGKTINITPAETSGPKPTDFLPYPLEELKNVVYFLDGELISEEAFLAMSGKEIGGVKVFRATAASEYLQGLKDEGKFDGPTVGRDVVIVTGR